MFRKLILCMIILLFMLPFLFAQSVDLNPEEKIEAVNDKPADVLKDLSEPAKPVNTGNELKTDIVRKDETKVDVRGRIIIPYYKDGFILITACRVINGKEEIEPVSMTSINTPEEEYCLKVPKGVGYLNLYGSNLTEKQLVPNSETGYDNTVAKTPYSKNPVKVEDGDLTGIDIELYLTPTPPIMLNYIGSTVKVSGEVVMDDYKEGVIGITVGKDSFGAPTVTSMNISRPGKFEIEIAKNIGKVYIGAFNMKVDGEIPDNNTPQGQYAGNPLSIGEEDISNVVIVVGKK